MEIPSIFTLCAIAAIIAGVGYFIVQRVVKPIDVEKHQGFLDAMLSIVGTLVSILLGLLVAAALQDYEELEASIDKEASAVGHVFRLTSGLPGDTRNRIRKLCISYCDQVVNEDWPQMEHHKMGMNSFITLSKLINEAAVFEPSTEGQNNLHAELLAAVSEIVDYRRDRMLVLSSKKPQNLMPVLIMCSLIVLTFAYIYTRRGTVFHGALICLVAVALGANLGLVFILTNPFSSDWKIKPRGFLLNAEVLRKIQSQPELRELYLEKDTDKQGNKGTIEKLKEKKKEFSRQN